MNRKTLWCAVGTGLILATAACQPPSDPPSSDPVAETPVPAETELAASTEALLEADKSEAPAAPAIPPVTSEPAPDETVEAPVQPAAAAPAATTPEARVTPAAFARCQSCHSVEADGEHGIGPNLAGIVGQRVGSRTGYNYSEAMGAFEGVWTPTLLDAFLQNPRETVPGTKMMAPPVQDSDARRAIIAYLSAQ